MAKATAEIRLRSYQRNGDLHMQRRLMITAMPILIAATLLVSEVAAQANLPVQKNKFYGGVLICSRSQHGRREVRRGNDVYRPKSGLRQRHIGSDRYYFRFWYLQCQKQLGLGGGRGGRVPSRGAGLQRAGNHR